MIIRPLKSEEINLVGRVAFQLPADQREQLLFDLSCAMASPVNQEESRILFKIKGCDPPSYEGQYSFPVEIRVLDFDNSELTVVLCADKNGRLFELEIIRWDEEKLKGPIW